MRVNRLVDEVLALEKVAQMVYLEDAEADDAEEEHPREAMHALECGLVRSGEALFAQLHVLHFVEDFVCDLCELAQLGFHTRERLLIRNCIVVDGLATELHVEINVAEEVVAFAVV